MIKGMCMPVGRGAIGTRPKTSVPKGQRTGTLGHGLKGPSASLPGPLRVGLNLESLSQRDARTQPGV
jgi:hypothetical protein